MLALVVTVLVVALPVVVTVTVVAAAALEAAGVKAAASAPRVVRPAEAPVVASIASTVVLVVAAGVVPFTAVGRRMRPGARTRPGAAETVRGRKRKRVIVTLFVLHREKRQEKILVPNDLQYIVRHVSVCL